MARGLIACVLKSGGDFGPQHVEWLRKQCSQHMPDWEFRCWSDMNVPDKIPLKRSWPKWWAKFEAYRDTCDCEWPMLMIDLDTVFVGTLEIRPEHKNEILIIRDPWKDGGRFPERLGGGFMYLPKWAREYLNYLRISRDMDNLIAENGGDDQPLLHEHFKYWALRFQDEYVDEIVSYKVHVKGIGLQPDNKVVYFHGKPRPWDVREDWIPKLGVDYGSENVGSGYQEAVGGS